MTPVRVVIYVRQSKDDRGDRLAVTRQLADAREQAKRRDWTVVDEIEDNDTSAAGKVARPGFDRIMGMVDRGEATAILAWDLTRLTRNRRDTVRLIETCQHRNIVIALCRGGDIDLSTPAGRLTADVLAAFARQEIEQKSDRQKAAARQAAEQGRPSSLGRRAFGYEPDGMTIRETERAAVERIYEQVIAGTPLAQICRELTAAGHYTPQHTHVRRDENGDIVKPARPSAWQPQTITNMIRNPRYAGIRAVLREPDSGHGRRRWEHVGPAKWPAIVDTDTWRAACDVLTDPGRRRPARDGIGLLTGIARCGVCADGTTVHRGGSASTVYRSYRCRAAGHLARRGGPVDDYVTEHILARLEEDDARDLLYDEKRPDVAELRGRLAVLQRRLTAQAEMHAAGDLSDEQLVAGSRRLRADAATIERQLTDARRLQVLQPLIGAADVRAAWTGLPIERQRAVIDMLVTVVIYPPGRGRRRFDPATVQVNWK